MSPSTRCLVGKVRHIVPPMRDSFHKGQLGRVAVIGGSIDYTGAPYFSAMASAKLGCDMSHVICEPSAATVIKSYSPNLMVHPYLRSSSTDGPNPKDIPALAKPIIDFMARIHVLIIGPGLGRDPVTQKIVVEIIKEAIKQKMPMVFDADALMIVQEHPDLIKGYRQCILTPNIVEFGRLAKALGVEAPKGNEQDQTKACRELSQALGGVAIVQKGRKDVISNGITSILCDVEGGYKRSGGQGDTLTGSLGTFLAWRMQYHAGLWDSDPPTGERATPSSADIESELSAKDLKHRMSPETTLLLAAWAGSAITRECSRRAFAAKGRSLQASDLTEEVHGAFLSLIGEPEHIKL
ncbi:hypothetical protein KEM56_006589 [Ascosphaera pollenicola]|nr:hypothetical protein KEM56_006589 [Ascosphaera pollenicola]